MKDNSIFSDENSQNQILKELRLAGKILRAANNKNEVFDFTIRVFSKLGFERIRIWLMDEDKNEFFGAKCSYVPDAEFQKIRGDLSIKKSSPYQTHALSKKRPFINRSNFLLKGFLDDQSTKETIEFPIIAGQRTLGSIGVDNEISGRAINLKEIESKIMPFVNHIALVLYRVIAEEKIRKANSNLKKEINYATLELKKKNVELSYLAHHDDLSGLPNRRHFEKILNQKFKKISAKNPLTLCMLDIDFLKHVNDTHGHSAGDNLIKKIGKVLNADPAISLSARFAGDEFVFLTHCSTCKNGKNIFKRVLDKIKRATKQTVSIGCISCPNPMVKKPIDLIRIADDALYHAKHTGRNRFVCACEEDGGGILSLVQRRHDLQKIEEQGTFAIDHIRQLNAINKISEYLRKNISEKIITQKVVKTFREDLKFKRVGIYLNDSDSKETILVAHSNVDNLLEKKITPARKVPKLDFWIKKVICSKRIANLDEKEIPPVFTKLFGIRRVLIIPMLGRTTVLGVIVAEYDVTKIIRKSDLDFYLTIGDQIESGIIKLRALKKTQNFNQKLKSEVRLAVKKSRNYACSLEEKIKDNRELRKKEQLIHFELISAFITSLEEKDIYTRGHSLRVSSYAVKLGRKLGMDEQTITNLRYAGLLHDVGKVTIDQSILQKRTALSKDESRTLKKHPVIGQKIVSGVRFLKSTARIIKHHHERWDGSGYPSRLKGKVIPLESRILAIADSYDAMVTRRSYGHKMSKIEAVRELESDSRKQFDPKLTKIFVELLKKGKIRTPSSKFIQKNR